MVDVSALYAAENLEDGLAVLLKPMPHWLPLTSALTATALYYGSYRFRLLLSKVRHLQRYRIAKRQAEEDTALHAATQQSLAELDNNNNNSSSSSIARSPNGDPTEVSDLDVREFCMSLGILLPRDDDLQLRIEQMIHGDPIPEGFALVRTSGGYIRYQNQQTEELTFFYSAELRREICETVKQRNEADYKTFFVDGDEQRFTSRNNTTAAAVTGGSSSLFSSWRQQPTTTTTTASSAGDAMPEPKSLRKIDWNEVDEQETAAGGAGEKSVGWQAFHDVLNYFVAREKAKIEAEAQQQQLRSEQATKSNSSNEPTPSNSAVKRSTITKRARVSISYAPKQPMFFDSRSAAPPVPASLPPVAPKAVATASAPPTAAASAAVLPPSGGSHGGADEDSVVLTPSAPPATANGAPAPRRPSLGDGSEPQQQHYTPAGLPPVPKRVPTPRSSRQNSPMEGGGSSSLRRTDSNLSNSGTQPRTPTWRAKSPTQGSLPPPHVTL